MILLATAAPTLAQQGLVGGQGPRTTSPAQIEKDSSAVVPSAGTSGPSAAPTMVRDCVKEPQHCTTPPSPGDHDTARGDQSSPAPDAKKNKAP